MSRRGGQTVEGFTLVEMMVCVAVVAILVSIMLPAYQSQRVKSRRSVGTAALLMVLARQEQYFVMNKHYAHQLDSLGYKATVYAIGQDGEELPMSSARRIYRISIHNLLPEDLPQQFVLRATPQLAQMQDSACGVLELSSVGVKSAFGLVRDCW